MEEKNLPREYPEREYPEVVRPMDRVRWGPILGGMVTTLATILLLSILGVAIGLSVVGPGGTVGDLTTGAGIWGGLSALVAFFLGGWVAGRSEAISMSTRYPFPGLLNGALVWATTVILLLLLSALGAGGALGYFGTSFNAITGSLTTGEAVTGAWTSFIALLLSLAAAMFGGWVGYTRQPGREVVR